MAITFSGGKIGSTLLSQPSAPQKTNNYVSTNPTQNVYAGNAVRTQASVPTGGSATSGGQVAAPSTQSFSGAPMQEAPSAPSIDFDALIAPALAGLDAAIGPLQQSNAADIQGIESNRQTQAATTNQQLGAQTNTINTAKETQRGYERSAADEARRQYSEVQQGIQSRYGGTTGTGAFATELAGGQAIRSIANVHEAAGKAIAGLDDKLVQVQEIGRIALQDIENQARDQTAKAKSNLELALADIRNQKGQLLAHKAEMAANAMQHYQDTVNQVNANNTAFKQQLFMQQQAAQQQLEAARSRATSIVSNAQPTGLGGYVDKTNLYTGQGQQAAQVGAGGGSINLGKTSPNSIDDLINQQLNAQGL
jgi:hypothetical protein